MMRIVKVARSVSRSIPSMNAESYVKASVFLTVVFLSITIRLHNITLGFYLGEFDPYWHYRCAEYIMNNGLFAFLQWVDNMSWYPYGRAAAPSTPPGLPLAAVFLHAFINSIGVSLSLMDVAILFPPIVSVLAVVAVFFLGRDLSGNDWVGLLAMLFLAFNGSFIDRSHLGFFKHESLGIPLIAISAYLYFKSVKSNNINMVFLYSLLSGLVLGYLCISWTAYIYMIGLVVLFSVLVTLFADPGVTDRTLVSYAITMGLSIIIAIQFPRPGAGAVYSVYYVAVIVGFAVILISKYLKRIEASLTIPIFVGFVSLALSATLLLFSSGMFSSLIGKLVAVLNPSARFEQAIVESVAEHKMSTWYSLYSDHGLLLLLFMIGVVLSIFQVDRVSALFTVSAGLSSLYFANMMVRIGLVFSPFLSLVSAIGGFFLIKSSYPVVSERIKMGRKVAYKTRLLGVMLSSIIVLSMGFHGVVYTGLGMYVGGISVGHVQGEGAASLPSSSIPTPSSFPDWIEALTWIRYNTPPGSVILSWWDYGYWITVLGERPTLIDNATINSTQVALVGRIFMSDDTVAMPLMKRYNVSYVVVFSTLSKHWWVGSWGDEGKWTWMAAIGYDLRPVNASWNWIASDYSKGGYGDENLTKKMQDAVLYSYQEYSLKYLSAGVVLPRRDSVLTRLMINAYMEELKRIGLLPSEEFMLSTSPFYHLVFLSPSNGFVAVYKVNYTVSYGEESIEASSNLGNSSKFYDLPLVPGINMTIDVRNLHIVEGKANINNASKVLTANTSIVVKYGENSLEIYLLSPAKYSFIYSKENNMLEIMVNNTLLKNLLLPEGLKKIEVGLMFLAEGVKEGLETPAYADAEYKVKLQVP
ncbi:MAG: STT3 domain-containing protein [Thermoproteota archaeon]